MTNDNKTVREVCAEITEATMRVGAFFTPTIYEWRDSILSAHEREMKSVRQCLTGDCERFKLGAEPCTTCTVYAYERELAAKDAEIALLKRALKPVMDVTWSKVWGSGGCYTTMASTSTDLAVREAQRIMKEGEAK